MGGLLLALAQWPASAAAAQAPPPPQPAPPAQAAPAAQPTLPPNMRTYIVAMMKKGPAWTADATPEVAEVQQGEMAFLQRLEASKQLIGGGPINDASDLRAVFVLDLPSVAAATQVLAEDPAVKAGRLVPHVLQWFAEKGVGDAYFARKARNPDEVIPLADYQFGLLMRGASTQARTPERAAEIQKGHIANLEAMHAAGLLAAAGPFTEGGDFRGIVIFKGTDYGAVFDAVEKDPAVRAGRLVLRLYRWKVAEGVFKF